jgi:hypothetical protein
MKMFLIIKMMNFDIECEIFHLEVHKELCYHDLVQQYIDYIILTSEIFSFSDLTVLNLCFILSFNSTKNYLYTSPTATLLNSSNAIFLETLYYSTNSSSNMGHLSSKFS